VQTVFVSGAFDNLQSRQVRFLQKAAYWGKVHVLLWSDQAAQRYEGRLPRYPEQERQYLLQSLRFVHDLTLSGSLIESLPLTILSSGLCVIDEAEPTDIWDHFCQDHQLRKCVIKKEALVEFAAIPPAPQTNRKTVVVTGCYDWLHSGHVRFFEEVYQLGNVYVIVGSDQNVRLLKGDGHPLFGQEERRYLVGAIRHVTESLISTGSGWMDAAPEIEKLKPDIYAVNEDGDKPEKRDFCEQRGIEYIVLKRTPKNGLVQRTSTDLRGF